MAARKSNSASGIDAVFEAIDALTYREHRDFADLLAMQAEGRQLEDRDGFAELLADTCDSYLADDEDEGAA